MKDSSGAFWLISLCAVFIGLLAGRCLDKPSATPCDGQLVTGAIGTIEFRYCIHPTVVR